MNLFSDFYNRPGAIYAKWEWDTAADNISGYGIHLNKPVIKLPSHEIKFDQRMNMKGQMGWSIIMAFG